jgi:hypothetical protein
MAYIGFDCPPISVIGNLSNRRWPGWLEQLVMRGGRMWGARPEEEQRLVVIAPNDPLMAQFAERFRKDSEAGLRERKKRGPVGPPVDDPDYVGVSDAQITDQVSVGLTSDQDLAADEYAGLQGLRSQLSTPVDISILGEVFRKAGLEIPKVAPERRAHSESSIERRKRLGGEVQSRLSKLIWFRYRIRSRTNREEYQKHISHLTRELNRSQGVPNSEHLTDAQWEERKRLLDGSLFAFAGQAFDEQSSDLGESV